MNDLILKVPSVHLNGTSKDELVETYDNAREALSAAYDALAKTVPHARDYYVQDDPNAAMTAHHEHMARIRKLADIQNELAYILIRVMKQRTRND